MKLSDIILEGWTPEKYTAMGKTSESKFTGQADNIQDFFKALDKLPVTIESIKVPTNTTLFKTSEDYKIFTPSPSYMEKVKEQIQQVANQYEQIGTPVDEFILATYGGQFEKDQSTAEYYIKLQTTKSRKFSKDMASGKYGSLD